MRWDEFCYFKPILVFVQKLKPLSTKPNPVINNQSTNLALQYHYTVVIWSLYIHSGYYGNVDHGWEKDAGGCVKTKSCHCNTEGLYTNTTMVITWIVLLALGGPGCNIRDNGASRFYRI